jgi:hypothetical protein
LLLRILLLVTRTLILIYINITLILILFISILYTLKMSLISNLFLFLLLRSLRSHPLWRNHLHINPLYTIPTLNWRFLKIKYLIFILIILLASNRVQYRNLRTLNIYYLRQKILEIPSIYSFLRFHSI